MSLRELLTGLGYHGTYGDSDSEESQDPAKGAYNAWMRLRGYFDEFFSATSTRIDPTIVPRIREDLSLMSGLVEPKQPEETKPTKRIKQYYLTVSDVSKPSNQEAMAIMKQYFTEWKVQEDTLSSVASLVFPELEIIQRHAKTEELYFGRQNRAIIEGQTAFRRVELGRVEVGVLRPFEDCENNEASICLFEYRIKDFAATRRMAE